MTREETMMLLGVAAYIVDSFEKEREFGDVLMNVAHDIGGMARYGSVEAADLDCFLPRTHGFAKEAVTKGNLFMLSGSVPEN